MKNALKAKLRDGQTCANGWLSMCTGYGAEVMARCSWDSITVDLQHGVQDYMTMVQAFQAMAASGVPSLVRVASNEPGIVGKVLDAGAWGVICPMTNTVEEARAFVSACLYPPAGTRSNGPNRAAAYGDAEPYQRFANDEVLVFPMIETEEAVSNLEAILDIPGVSGVYVGPSDLGFSMGLEPKFDRDEPQILAIYERIVAETARRGLTAGIHTIDPAYAVRMSDMGFRFVTLASDASLMMKGARDALKVVRDGTAASGGRAN